MLRILTLYLCKNQQHFNLHNFNSVKNQSNISQEIVIVSAEPVTVEGIRNIVVPVKKDWPLPVKVGYSVNTAIRRLQLEAGFSLLDYDYIFKVDSDVKLPSDYIENLTLRKPPVAGIGAALLISVPFFLVKLKGTYPMNYCDDGYIAAMSISLGAWPPQYSGYKRTIAPPVRFEKERELAYGMEYYRWGLSPLIMLLLPFAARLLRLAQHEKRGFKAHLINASGYILATLKRLNKYGFHSSYRRVRNRHFAEKVLGALARPLSIRIENP
jgi:hypothetical protein